MSVTRLESIPTKKRPLLSPRSPIPDKLYFKIGEVAELVGVQAHVLRYWEKEVPALRPGKSASNQRRYRRRDIEMFREIKRLLHDERYTLAGAKKRLSGGEVTAADMRSMPVAPVEDVQEMVPVIAAQPVVPAAPVVAEERIAKVRKTLLELIELSAT